MFWIRSTFSASRLKLGNVTVSLKMVLYPVLFDLQGRRGSGGQQGLAGTPGAAVRIDMKKKPMRRNILLSYIGSILDCWTLSSILNCCHPLRTSTKYLFGVKGVVRWYLWNNSRSFCPVHIDILVIMTLIAWVFIKSYMVTFFVFDDDFMPSVQTSTIFVCFTRENSKRLQAS